MPLLLLPLLLLALVALWALLLPVSLWLRYRNGRARRRAIGWVVNANAWALALSAGVFLIGAWIGGHWIADALRDACLGLLAGIAFGLVALWASRFEPRPDGFHFTPNRWLALLLTALVAGRIALGLWQGWERWHAASPGHLAWRAGLFALAGLLLGHALAYAWGLRVRFGRWRRCLN
jgi:hypothetical protein